MNLIIRKAKTEDIRQIMIVFDFAKSALKDLNIDQWQNNYPNEEVIKNDLRLEQVYVVEINFKIVATFVLSFEHEVAYENIEGVGFKDSGKYGVIHRIAILDAYKGQGIGDKIIEKSIDVCLEKNVHSIKADTHRGNIVMQKFLLKHLFEYRGDVHIISEGDTLRFVYERIIS